MARFATAGLTPSRDYQLSSSAGRREGMARDAKLTCYLRPTVLTESDPSISCPLKVSPVRDAELAPHSMSVSWVRNWRIRSVSPSPSTSSKAECVGAASVPLAPKSTVVGFTVVASKAPSLRIATGILPWLRGFDAIRRAARFDIDGYLFNDPVEDHLDIVDGPRLIIAALPTSAASEPLDLTCRACSIPVGRADSEAARAMRIMGGRTRGMGPSSGLRAGAHGELRGLGDVLPRGGLGQRLSRRHEGNLDAEGCAPGGVGRDRLHSEEARAFAAA